MVQSSSTKNGFKVKGGNDTLSYDRKNRLYVDLLFSNGIGSSLFIPSSCDPEGQVDLCVRRSAPSLRKTGASGMRMRGD